jgi:hypothetical protein
VISAIVQGVVPDAAGPAAGTLLADVRAMAASGEPRAVFLASFLAQRSVARDAPDPLDPATTPELFLIDPAGLALVMWTSLRSALIDAAAAVDAPVGLRAPETEPAGVADAAGFVGSMARRTSPTLCTAPTDEEAWVLFITKLVGSGLEVGQEAIAIPGIANVISGAVALQAVDADAAEALGKKVGVGLQVAGLVTAAASALMAYAATGATVSMDPSPLERLRERAEGKTATATITISYQNGVKDEAAELGCAMNVLGRLAGAEVSVPIEGTKVSGADVIPEAGRNVPSKVLFDVGSRVLTTGGDGVATLPLKGAARREKLPETAVQYDDTFSIRIYAQFEGVSAQGILDTFIGGLAGTGIGALGVLVNILKTIRYDMGTFTLPLKDWKAEGYRIPSPVSETPFLPKGVICGFDQEFSLDMFELTPGVMIFTPTSPGQGTLIADIELPAGVRAEVSGQWRFDPSDPENPRIVITGGETRIIAPPPGGVQTVPWVPEIPLEPAGEGACV